MKPMKFIRLENGDVEEVDYDNGVDSSQSGVDELSVKQSQNATVASIEVPVTLRIDDESQTVMVSYGCPTEFNKLIADVVALLNNRNHELNEGAEADSDKCIAIQISWPRYVGEQIEKDAINSVAIGYDDITIDLELK